jgi:Ca-activated chloride channel family protein
MRRPGTSMAVVASLVVAALAIGVWQVGWADLWMTPDQRGRRLMAEQNYREAGKAFADPMWAGVARFRAGEFKDAAETFGGLATAAAAYDQGNALVMLGKYDDAVGRYDRALALRPGWADAEANRTLARLRAEMMRQKGADAGDQREGADEIVYDKDKKNQEGQKTEVTGAVMTDEASRAVWLKRLQSRPADFLRARFVNQLESKAP